MSTPIDQLQPPPVAADPEQGSIGAVIAVLAIISILGVIAGTIGRLCSGRPVLGYDGQYDVEDWIEKKCASCLDGSLDPPPPPPLEAVPVAEPVGGLPDMKQGGEPENLQATAPGSGGES